MARPVTQHPRVLVPDLVFPEAPRWYNNRFWFSDIHAHRVLTGTPEGVVETMAELDDRPAGLGFLPDGTPLVVSMIDRRLLRINPDGTTAVHADVSHLTPGFINDMVVDATGRAYVGSRNGGPPGTDSVILVTPDGEARAVLTDATSPNGTIISADGGTLVLAETHVDRLVRFTVGDDGSLHDRQVFAHLPGVGFDGICLDDGGMVWAGHGAALVRVAEGGTVERRIDLDLGDLHVIACVLGGEGRRTMFMSAAKVTQATFDKVGLDRTKDVISEARGMVCVVDLDVSGAGIP